MGESIKKKKMLDTVNTAQMEKCYLCVITNEEKVRAESRITLRTLTCEKERTIKLSTFLESCKT